MNAKLIQELRKIARNQNIDLISENKYDLIKEFKQKIDWAKLSQFEKPSYNFIDNFKDDIRWDFFLTQGIEYEKTYLKYKDKVKPFIGYCLVYYDEQYSEEFLREFQDHIDWGYVMVRYDLPRDFLNEFKFKFADKSPRYWANISLYDPLKENFIRTFIDKLNFDYLMKNEEINRNKELKEKIGKLMLFS